MTALPMSESSLLATVLDLAARLGLKTAHFRTALAQSGRWVTPVAGDGKGFPDTVIVGAGGVIFRELKTATGRLSAEQRAWLAALTAAGADAQVWRPADLSSGRIEAELRAIRRAASKVAAS